MRESKGGSHRYGHHFGSEYSSKYVSSGTVDPNIITETQIKNETGFIIHNQPARANPLIQSPVDQYSSEFKSNFEKKQYKIRNSLNDVITSESGFQHGSGLTSTVLPNVKKNLYQTTNQQMFVTPRTIGEQILDIKNDVIKKNCTKTRTVDQERPRLHFYGDGLYHGAKQEQKPVEKPKINYSTVVSADSAFTKGNGSYEHGFKAPPKGFYTIPFAREGNNTSVSCNDKLTDIPPTASTVLRTCPLNPENPFSYDYKQMPTRPSELIQAAQSKKLTDPLTIDLHDVLREDMVNSKPTGWISNEHNDLAFLLIQGRRVSDKSAYLSEAHQEFTPKKPQFAAIHNLKLNANKIKSKHAALNKNEVAFIHPAWGTRRPR